MSLPLETPAQQRFAEDVLAWGGPRPAAPPGLVDVLRSRLETAVERWRPALSSAGAERPGRRLSIGRKVLERRVCDGWQREPAPFVHGWASVRATLAREVIAADWLGARAIPAPVLVGRVWHEAATRRPGDPSSRSAWMNRRASDEARQLRDELVALLEDVREVWPALPVASLSPAVRQPVEVSLGGGLVTLYGVPDLVLDSKVEDDRARGLVVDLRTGQPRPQRDRGSSRFHALLVTLARGRPPFRWASYHVVEGRTEQEDLTSDALEAACAAVVEVIEQHARLAQRQPERVAGGPWCVDCRRRDSCPAAVPGPDRLEVTGMSHPSSILGS